MKICSKCKIEKNESDFGVRGGGGKHATSLRSYCKSCGYAVSNRYKKENKEKLYTHTKEWRQKNPSKVKAYHGNYYKNHKEQILKKTSAYYYNNKEHLIKKQKEYNNTHREHCIGYLRRYCKTKRDALHDSYVKVQLRNKGYTSEQIEIVPELIPIKKVQIINHRITKSKNK